MKEMVQQPAAEESIVFRSEAMQEIRTTIERIANFDSAILLTGERGSGKSRLARYIHQTSHRSKGPYVVFHCLSVPADQAGRMMFGDDPDDPGAVAAAEGGILYIDEIGALPMDVQNGVMELLSMHTYRGWGTSTLHTASVQIISSTSLPLEKQIPLGKFREDLYYSLRVIEFDIPPLRRRHEDFDEIVNQFLQRYNKRYGMQKHFSARAKALLRQYDWPGNISELENVVERAVIISREEEIGRADLPETITAARSDTLSELPADFDEAVDAYKRQIMEAAYARWGSSYQIAKGLHITQTRASRMMREYVIGRSHKKKKQKN